MGASALAAALTFGGCVTLVESAAADFPVEWPAATTATRVTARVSGLRGYVAMPGKARAPLVTGTFDLLSDTQFSVHETDGGADRTYTGTYAVRRRDHAMRLTLDDAGKAALLVKINTVATPTTGSRVTITKFDVVLDGVTTALLHRPPMYRLRRATFRATGSYAVTWRYDSGLPFFPPYYDITTWRFAFRWVVTVGPGN